MIYENATARHLGFARILVFGLLLVDLLIDPLQELADFTAAAFVPRGVLRLIPEPVLAKMLTTDWLLTFKWFYALVLLLCIIGTGPRVVMIATAIVCTTLFDGLATGFGGHVNHQEIIVLHCAILLLFFPCYDALALNHATGWAAQGPPPEQAIYRLGMRVLCFWISLSYFYIGLSRLSTSGLRDFFTNTLESYVLMHSVKWNWWNFSLGRNVLTQRWLQILLAIAFPIATLFEMAAPLAVFLRRLTIPIVIALLIFHVFVLCFMNIFFWQNMFLLVLFFFGLGGARLNEAAARTLKRSPAHQ